MTVPFIPLQLFGQLVGVTFVGFALGLGFRHIFIDGYRYPLGVSLGALVAGLGMMLVVTEVVIVNYLQSYQTTYLGYLCLWLAGWAAFYYFWVEYPRNHPSAPCPD